MDSENFNLISAGLLAWVNKLIHSLGGRGLVPIKREKPDEETDCGEMLEAEKKILFAVILLSQAATSVYSSANELGIKADDYIDRIWEEAMTADENDFEPGLSLDSDEIKSELSEADMKYLEDREREMNTSPYDSKIETLLKRGEEICWQRDCLYCMLVFSIGLRLGFTGEIRFNKGYRVSLIPGTDQISLRPVSVRSMLKVLDNRIFEKEGFASMPETDRSSLLEVVVALPLGSS